MFEFVFIDLQVAISCSLGSFTIRDATSKKDADYLKVNSRDSGWHAGSFGRAWFGCVLKGCSLHP
jgi:hypothetical protein